MTKFLNISTDTTLGGSSASDDTVSSQKAIKAYVDSQTGTAPSFANITGQPTDNTNLANALNAKYDASNPNGYTSNVGTVTSVNNVSPVSGNVTLSIPTVTDTYSATSSNAMSGKAVASAISGKQDTLVSGTSIKTVNSTSLLGSGNIAVQSVIDANNKLDYAYLSNTPTIPTVNNATLTITQGGTTKGTFTANASSNVTIDLDSGGSVNVDNKSITENSSNQLQTVGVINSRDSSTAIKTWTGTRQQYDAIVTKDSATLYNITDDTDVSLTILEALYPVGSVYITTANTCPLSTLISGSTWTLVSSGIVKAGDIPCKGNGMALGLTDDYRDYGAIMYSNNSISPYTLAYGSTLGEQVGSGGIYPGNAYTVGITTDSTKSGIVADTASLTLSVNIFERTA